MGRFKETLKKSSLTLFRDENYKCDNLRFSHIKRFSQIKKMAAHPSLYRTNSRLKQRNLISLSN